MVTGKTKPRNMHLLRSNLSRNIRLYTSTKCQAFTGQLFGGVCTVIRVLGHIIGVRATSSVVGTIGMVFGTTNRGVCATSRGVGTTDRGIGTTGKHVGTTGKGVRTTGGVS